MITRRGFLKYIPSLPILVAIPAGIIGNRLGTASKAKAETKPKPKPKHYTMTCQEISTREVNAVYLGDNLAWSETLREISWNTDDINFVPDVGDTLEMEQNYSHKPTESFSIRVVSVMEIK